METNHEARIRELSAEIESNTKIMEGLAQDFTKATISFASSWIQDKVQSTVTTRTDTTQSLGIEGLRQLKTDLKKVIDHLPEVAQPILDDDSNWEHRTGISDDGEQHKHCYSAPKDDHYSDKLDWPIRSILGLAGDILRKNGFEATATRMTTEWSEKLPHESGYPGTQGTRYVRQYKRSPEMLNILRSYADLHRKMVGLSSQLKLAQRQKAEAEAKNLWDQA